MRAPEGLPPCAEALWQQAGSTEGLILCGHPFEDEYEHGKEAIPLGTNTFTRSWLAKRWQRQKLVYDKLLHLVNHAAPGQCMVHHAWFLTRTVTNLADIHLWRTVAYDQMVPFLTEKRDYVRETINTTFGGMITTEMDKHLLWHDAREGGLGLSPPLIYAAIHHVAADLDLRAKNPTEEAWSRGVQQALFAVDAAGLNIETILAKNLHSLQTGGAQSVAKRLTAHWIQAESRRLANEGWRPPMRALDDGPWTEMGRRIARTVFAGPMIEPPSSKLTIQDAALQLHVRF